MMTWFKWLVCVSWEGNLCWLGAVNLRLICLVYKQVAVVVGLAIGMMGILDRVVPVRIRQGYGHTSALLEQVPWQMPDYLRESG